MDVGTYSVIVTDSTGCFTELSFNAYDPYVITFGGAIPPTCPGDSNGMATVNSSGCPCMFSTCVFDWDSGDNGKTATSLSSGWQTVTITHMDGCVVVDSVLVPQSAPVLDSLVANDIDCAHDPYASSSVQLYLNDSVSTVVSWNTGQTTAYIDSLDVGTYYVDLYDSTRNCFHSDSASISAPDTLLLDVSSSAILCFGDNSGTISAIVSGGMPVYQYNWSNMDSTATISNLAPGFYSLEVIDSLGCSVQADSIEISEPPQLVSSIVSFWNDSTGTCQGGAIALASGGVSPLNYVWNTTPSTANDTVNGLCEGTYTVTITDSNGCVVLDSVSILNTLSIEEIGISVLLYPNPTENHVTIVSQGSDLINREYYVSDETGRIVANEQISSHSHTIDFSSYANGIYFLSIDGLEGSTKIVKK